MKFKIKLYPLLLIVSLLLSACREKAIDVETMADIITDIYIIDNATVFNSPEERNKLDTLLIYKPIVEKYGHTMEEFRASFDYYLGEKETIAEIYGDVRHQLKAVKTRLDSVRTLELAEEKRIRDIAFYSNLADSVLNRVYIIKALDWHLHPVKTFAFYKDTVPMTPNTPIWWDSVGMKIIHGEWYQKYLKIMDRKCCSCDNCVCMDDCQGKGVSCGCCENCKAFHAKVKEKEELEKKRREEEEKRLEAEKERRRQEAIEMRKKREKMPSSLKSRQVNRKFNQRELQQKVKAHPFNNNGKPKEKNKTE